MGEFGLNVKTDSGGKRVEIECEHQNGLLYVVPAESSWVCSEELMHAHAIAGFFRQLMELEDERVEESIPATPNMGRLRTRCVSPPTCWA